MYVIGMLFNCLQESSIVRISTLLDKLDTNVRTQANRINHNKMDSSNNGDIKHKKGHKYEIGTKLLEFMIERNLIHIETVTADGKKAVVKETGKVYLESNLFAVCDFDLSLIPIKLNLPMVCKPLDWVHITDTDYYKDNKIFFEFDIKKPFVLSDMVGGYLSSPSLDIYNSLSLGKSLGIDRKSVV